MGCEGGGHPPAPGGGGISSLALSALPGSWPSVSLSLFCIPDSFSPASATYGFQQMADK